MGDPDSIPDSIHLPAEDLHNQAYALSGKIMLSAIVILFFVVILMVCLHLYARWYLLRARRRQLRRRNHHRRTHLVFYVDTTAGHHLHSTATHGLDAAVLKSLPVFTFSSNTHADPIECAVCLSDFEENESGRLLPKCNHRFHIDCIDMWFHSHSTCPICRAPVEAGSVPDSPVDIAIRIPEPAGDEPGSNSGLCSTCQQHEGEQAAGSSTSSFGGRRKPFLGIEVPRRNNEGLGFESESCDSPATQQFRSPMSRMLSFKRILSRDRRASISPSGSGNTPSSSCSGSVTTTTQSDMESGRDPTR